MITIIVLHAQMMRVVSLSGTLTNSVIGACASAWQETCANYTITNSLLLAQGFVH